MNDPNLFEHLEGYAQENFTTETLAYILQTDKRVRKKLVALLLQGRPKRMQAAFEESEIDTQFSYDIGRPDIKITSRKSRSRIFIEVKIHSQDQHDQIEKYLKLGYVACLTPLRIPVSNANSKFLGHFFWYQVHSIINRVGSNSDIHQQFLKFLEARHMGPSEPVSKEELRAATHAVAVIRKFHEIVNGVREKIAPDWEKQFGENTGQKSVTYGLGNESLPSWLYRTKLWKKAGSGGFYLWIGIEVDRQTHRPQFFLGIVSHQKKFAHQVECDFEDEFQKLKKHGWKKDPPGYDWCFAKFFPLSEGSIDKIASEQAKNVTSATVELQKIIRLMKNKI